MRPNQTQPNPCPVSDSGVQIPEVSVTGRRFSTIILHYYLVSSTDDRRHLSVYWSDLHLDALQRIELGLLQREPEHAVTKQAVADRAVRAVVCTGGSGDGVGGLGPADWLLAVPAGGLVDSVEVAR